VPWSSEKKDSRRGGEKQASSIELTFSKGESRPWLPGYLAGATPAGCATLTGNPRGKCSGERQVRVPSEWLGEADRLTRSV